MVTFPPLFLLRLCVAAILLAHSVPSIATNSVYDFGTQYLDKVGFAPFGLVLAWGVKLSHIVAAVALLLNRHIKWPIFITLLVLVAGIVMIHGREGWFVVGGGRNGMEFNLLLIAALLTILYPEFPNGRR